MRCMFEFDNYGEIMKKSMELKRIMSKYSNFYEFRIFHISSKLEASSKNLQMNGSISKLKVTSRYFENLKF